MPRHDCVMQFTCSLYAYHLSLHSVLVQVSSRTGNNNFFCICWALTNSFFCLLLLSNFCLCFAKLCCIDNLFFSNQLGAKVCEGMQRSKNVTTNKKFSNFCDVAKRCKPKFERDQIVNFFDNFRKTAALLCLVCECVSVSLG